MSKIIHVNKTRYSSRDIEDLYAAFMPWLKGKIAASPGIELAEGGGLSYRAAVGRVQGVTLAYWTGPWAKGQHRYACSLSYGHTDEGHIGVGPWFVKNCYPDDESTNLNVRTPNNAMECLSPVEALASSNKMPRAMMSQLLFCLLPLVGYRIQSQQAVTTNFRYDRPFRRHSMEFAKLFVRKHPNLSVRVLKNVEHKVTPSTKKQQLDRLVETFKNGSAATDLKWKVWAIRNTCDELAGVWIKNYRQLQRVLAKAQECDMEDSYAKTFAAIADERRISKMLRQLADQHEMEELRLINALAKEKK